MAKAKIPIRTWEPTDAARSPEQRLLFAIIERAVRDAVGRLISDQDRNRARRWLRSDDYCNFSFQWIVREIEMTTTQVNHLRNFIAKLDRVPDKMIFSSDTMPVLLNYINQ